MAPFQLPTIHDPILQFTALVTLALVMKLSFERLGIPGLIGLLLAGMLVGPDGFGLLPRGEVMELLGTVGLVYVMFVAGLEIDLDVFHKRRRETVTFGLLAFTISLAPAAAAGWMLGYSIESALMLGALLSSHTLLAFPIVSRLGLVERPAVVTAIGGTLVTDTLALLLLAVVVEMRGEGEWWRTPAVVGGFVAFAAAAIWLGPRLGKLVFDRPWATRAERALFVLALLLIFAALTELMGLEDILGAFVAGVALNRALNRREDLLEHIEFAGKMLFIPFFFISTGMLLELQVIVRGGTAWLLAGLLLGLLLFSKSAASWLAGSMFGYRPLDRVLMIGMTLPQAAATLAVTMTAREADLLGDEVVDAVVVLIFCSCLLGPLAVKLAGGRLRERLPEGNR